MAGSAAKPVTIDCLRFHPKGTNRVEISCFAANAGVPAGGPADGRAFR